MKHTYNVGDAVKIRTDLSVGETYGCNDFVENMGRFRGETAKIVLAHSDKDMYKLDVEPWFWWTAEMLNAASESDLAAVKKFTPKDVTDGMFGITSTGDRFVVVNHNLAFQNGYWVSLDDYDENFEVIYPEVDERIMAIYDDMICFNNLDENQRGAYHAVYAHKDFNKGKIGIGSALDFMLKLAKRLENNGGDEDDE